MSRTPPISPGRPEKVAYAAVQLAWKWAREANPTFTKSALARELGLNVRTVRYILNGHRPRRKKKPEPSILLCGWTLEAT